MKSKYFVPENRETILDVLKAEDCPISSANVYAHLQRHQNRDLIKAPIVPPIMDVLEGDREATTAYEKGLDDFIQEGRNKLARGEMEVSPTNFLQAIKVKGDLQKGMKDRRMEMIKNFFTGERKLDEPEKPRLVEQSPSGS